MPTIFARIKAMFKPTPPRDIGAQEPAQSTISPIRHIPPMHPHHPQPRPRPVAPPPVRPPIKPAMPTRTSTTTRTSRTTIIEDPVYVDNSLDLLTTAIILDELIQPQVIVEEVPVYMGSGGTFSGAGATQTWDAPQYTTPDPTPSYDSSSSSSYDSSSSCDSSSSSFSSD